MQRVTGKQDLADTPPDKRVEAYIENVALALEELQDKPIGDEKLRRVIDLARMYLDDARYYYEKGDYFTALACIAYAEGLIDALRWLGHVELEWRPTTSLLERPKVLVAGTFDIIHPGHVELLRQAWLRGRVYVVVARDESVRRFKNRDPIVPEQQRLETVQAIRYVHQAVLGSTRDVLDPIREIKPDIILLGPDQWASEEWLTRQLEREGINARVERLPRKKQCPLCSTTAIACRAAKVIPHEACGQQE